MHTSKVVIDWFKEQNIKILEWPSLSPDLNIIENMWGELSRRVYGHGKQYSSKSELKAAIIDNWDEIGKDYVQNLCKKKLFL